MVRRILGLVSLFAAALALGSAPPLAAQSKAKAKSPFPGFEKQVMEGFTLYLHEDFLRENAASTLETKPLEALEIELKTIVKVMKADYVKKLWNLPIFVNWDTVEPGMPPGAIAFYTSGRDERRNCVVITNMKYITSVHQGDRADECVILHEFAHAIDHAFYNYQHPQVVKAYQLAMDRRLYGDPAPRGMPAKIYAATSSREYFAELTCAYLDKGRKPIADRQELKEHDPEGYKAMELVWGKNPERFVMKPRKKDSVATVAKKGDEKSAGFPKASAEKIAEAPPDREKQADNKLKTINILIGAGKTDAAKERLGDLIKAYPDTEAAKKSEEILKSLGN